MGLELTPAVKRWGMVGSAAIALVGISWILSRNVEDASGKAEASISFDGVIAPGDTRQTSLEGLAAQLKAAQARLDRMERAQRERGLTERRVLDNRLKTLRAELLNADEANRESLRREIQKLEAARAVLDGAPPASAFADMADPATRPGSKEAFPAKPPPETKVRAEPEIEPDSHVETDGAAGHEQTPRATSRALVEPAIYTARSPDKRLEPATEEEVIREVFASSPRSVPDGAPNRAARAEQGATLGGAIRTIRSEVPISGSDVGPGGSEVQLPAGSILTGVLLNGLDAPAGSQSARDPLPVLVRIKHEALLPSRFTANLSECFVLLAVHGELSSERAMMRGEELSCIMADGTVVQQDLAAYAVGEDGKVGLRGRIVSKQGAFLGNALIVGALQAASDAVSRGTDIAIGAGSGGGGSGGGLTSSITVGAGHALDRIAEWYLDRADELFPVVEVDPGRRIDLVLTTGMTFRVEL